MRKDLHLRCHNCIEYLTLADLGDGIVSLGITAWPSALRERLTHAWKALCGRMFWYSDVVLYSAVVDAVQAWLDGGEEEEEE